jgi:protein gp37
MNRTKIEWADYTWNPIKGLCPEACWYCYARRMYQRFGLDPTPRLELSGGTPDLYSTPSRVFVCSTFEIFHPVADQWRDEIFMHMAGLKHTFIILTKRPELIDRAMPDNVWLGVSVTGEGNVDYRRVLALQNAEARVRFVSMEPLLDDPCVFDLFSEFRPDWIILGRLTGHGHKHDPGQLVMDDIRMYAGQEDVPLFVKNNLAYIWPGPLIQEYPKDKKP